MLRAILFWRLSYHWCESRRGEREENSQLLRNVWIDLQLSKFTLDGVQDDSELQNNFSRDGDQSEKRSAHVMRESNISPPRGCIGRGHMSSDQQNFGLRGRTPSWDGGCIRQWNFDNSIILTRYFYCKQYLVLFWFGLHISSLRILPGISLKHPATIKQRSKNTRMTRRTNCD